jgi:hypothetical protein
MHKPSTPGRLRPQDTDCTAKPIGELVQTIMARLAKQMGRAQ